MSLVTVPEFRHYMSGMNLTAIQQQAAEAALSGVQSELERYINRSVQQRRVIEEADVAWDGRVYLDNTPIQAVYAIYSTNTDGTRGTSLPASSFPSGFFRKGANYLSLGGVGGCGTVYVDYLGGMNGDKIPGLKLAIMRVAAREFVYQHADGMAITNTELRPSSDPTPQPKGWTTEELASFDRYRRRTVL